MAQVLQRIGGVNASQGYVDIIDNQDGTASLGLSGAKVSTPAIASVTVAYAASATTDGIEATLTVKNADGATIAASHVLEVFISTDADGIGLTATAASGALTAVTGAILSVLTAKKHVSCVTAATGILTLKLVDSANTAGERFCVKNPLTSKVIAGAATVAGNYEGG